MFGKQRTNCGVMTQDEYKHIGKNGEDMQFPNKQRVTP